MAGSLLFLATLPSSLFRERWYWKCTPRPALGLETFKKIIRQMADGRFGTFLDGNKACWHIGKAIVAIRQAIPYAHCPRCGDKQGRPCLCCQGGGWVPRGTHQKPPAQDAPAAGE
jgi:hypothetical protein